MSHFETGSPGDQPPTCCVVKPCPYVLSMSITGKSSLGDVSLLRLTSLRIVVNTDDRSIVPVPLPPEIPQAALLVLLLFGSLLSCVLTFPYVSAGSVKDHSGTCVHLQTTKH